MDRHLLCVGPHGHVAVPFLDEVHRGQCLAQGHAAGDKQLCPVCPLSDRCKARVARGVFQVEAGQRCPLCKGHCVPLRSESSGRECLHPGSLVPR